MDYQKLYNALISHRKLNPPQNSYTERHHIIPRCMGGVDDKSNLVDLTAREHFVAHRLLAKIHPKERGLQRAVFLMAHIGDNKIASSREFEKLRIAYSGYRSDESTKMWSDLDMKKRLKNKIKKGLNNPKTKALISKSSKAMWDEDFKSKHSEKIKAKYANPDSFCNSEESRRNRSESTKRIAKQKWFMPWMNPKGVKTKRFWGYAHKFWELTEFNTLHPQQINFGCYEFARWFDDVKRVSIYRKMLEMFKEGWIPCECEHWLKEFDRQIFDFQEPV